MKQTKVGLAEAIESLRFELNKAIREKSKTQEGVGFTVQSVEVELQVIHEENSSGELSGGWSLMGWHMGGKAESGDSHTGVHTVKLTLETSVVDKEGRKSKVEIASEGRTQR